MANIVISEEQLKLLMDLKNKKQIKEDKDGSYMAKQQLFIIAKMAQAMWEKMEDDGDDQLEDWMESKIAQAEQSITSVVKTFMYDEFSKKEEEEIGGMNKLGYSDLIIGK